jgi:hypothetical protein
MVRGDTAKKGPTQTIAAKLVHPTPILNIDHMFFKKFDKCPHVMTSDVVKVSSGV